jgi:transcriptional regulator with XRE-family HTH domain
MQEAAQAAVRTLGRAVRKERERMRLSQEDFAERCDLHRTYVGQVERGEKNISVENILKISKALSMKPSRLFQRAKL